ncbi:glycine N-acyltransferase-like protein 3 [Tiliqua scincoides]|uniref:glycine N-acyltransferase-like protein 3 n=1 Tax=Tiliqua scincoides TaxID=71010 RepID=UPI003461E4A4
MLILTCPSKLQLLEGMLKRSLPLALPVHGAVMHINRGNPVQHEVVVDSWPEFKVVLTRPQRKVMKDKWDFFTNLYAAFYQDVDACQALLENAEAIDWSMAFQLHVLQDGVYKAVRSIAEARHVHLKPYSYLTALHPDPPSLSQKRLRNDLHIGTINSSHAALLNDTWSEGGSSHSLRYLDSLVRNFPCTGLFNKEWQLISWTLSDPVGCLTHSYTHPQYRGQGWIEVVTKGTAMKLYAHGFPVYGGVLAENHPSRQALKRQGFNFLPCTYSVFIVTPTLDPQT